MRLEIISAEKVLFKRECTTGDFTVPWELYYLGTTCPLISTLTHGNVVYDTGGGEKQLTIDSGVVEVMDNRIVVCIN